MHCARACLGINDQRIAHCWHMQILAANLVHNDILNVEVRTCFILTSSIPDAAAARLLLGTDDAHL